MPKTIKSKKPTSITPRQFQVDKEICTITRTSCDDGSKTSFKIAWGHQAESGVMTLGMRHTGLPGTSGYPNARGREAWFALDPDLTIPLLTGLLAGWVPGSNKSHRSCDSETELDTTVALAILSGEFDIET